MNKNTLFSLESLFVRVVYHSNKKETRTNCPDCSLLPLDLQNKDLTPLSLPSPPHLLLLKIILIVRVL